ncbi:MAG TPA: ribonuclease Z [Anaerolineae bacterium]|nr:ribonuclease Z [Anaerolineae bacterium]
MFELVFLGTSASAPSVERNLTSTLLIHDGTRFMLDCAEGTQRQILRSGVGFKDLRRIFLTHGHLDHILGIGGLVSTLGQWEVQSISKLEIYGGRWALDRVRDLMKVVMRGKEVEMELAFIEIKPGVLVRENDLTVSAFNVLHRGTDCFGFVFQEKSKRPFLADRAEALGIPVGPERKRLVAGEAITLADGRVIQPEDVLGELVPGLKFVYVGDLARINEVIEPARDADGLVMEATYLAQDRNIARKHGHITAAEAAICAREANVKQLFLTHISRRYSGNAVYAEASAIFPNTIVCNDLDKYAVRREK